MAVPNKELHGINVLDYKQNFLGFSTQHNHMACIFDVEKLRIVNKIKERSLDISEEYKI
jgi:hypothetical protein